MDIFSLSDGGDYLVASIPSQSNGNLKFTLSTAAAGSLAVANTEERQSYFSCTGVPEDRVAYFHQTHSKRVALVNSGAGLPIDADGGATADADVILSITVADCLPVALFDTRGGGFALVHSGWKGTGIAAAALELMRRRFGTRPDAVHAVIGPGIGGCCYNVPEERAAMFAQYGEAVVSRRGDAAYLDLKEANKALLENAGVQTISASSFCTSCSGFLGSYRREGPQDFTRMVAVVGYF